MRTLTTLDLIVALVLFALVAAAAVSGDWLAMLAIPPSVCAAVGMIAGRAGRGLDVGLWLDLALFAVALCGGA
jgi:hypothetical protein